MSSRRSLDLGLAIRLGLGAARGGRLLSRLGLGLLFGRGLSLPRGARRLLGLSPRRGLLLLRGVGLGLSRRLGLSRTIPLTLTCGGLLLGLTRCVRLLRGLGSGFPSRLGLRRSGLPLGSLLLGELGLPRLTCGVYLPGCDGPGVAIGPGLGRARRLRLVFGRLLLGELGLTRLAGRFPLQAGLPRGVGLHLRFGLLAGLLGLGAPRGLGLRLRPLGIRRLLLLLLRLPGLTPGRGGRRRRIGRRRPHAAAPGPGVDHRHHAGRVGDAHRPLAIPGGGLFSLVLLPPVAPCGLARLIRPPGLLLGDDFGAPLAPGLGIGRLALLMHRRVVERPGAGQIAGGAVGCVGVVAGRPAVDIIDHRQSVLVVAVGVLRIADQEGPIRSGLEIVAAIPVGRRLDHPVLAIVGAPDPGAHALVVDGVVRWAVGEGLAERIGAVDVTITLRRRRRDVADRRLGGERRDPGRGDHRRRCALGQGKARGGSAGDQVRGALSGVLVAGGQAEAGDRQ